jgi:hypothetical protein
MAGLVPAIAIAVARVPSSNEVAGHSASMLGVNAVLVPADSCVGRTFSHMNRDGRDKPGHYVNVLIVGAPWC